MRVCKLAHSFALSRGSGGSHGSSEERQRLGSSGNVTMGLFCVAKNILQTKNGVVSPDSGADVSLTVASELPGTSTDNDTDRVKGGMRASGHDFNTHDIRHRAACEDGHGWSEYQDAPRRRQAYSAVFPTSFGSRPGFVEGGAIIDRKVCSRVALQAVATPWAIRLLIWENPAAMPSSPRTIESPLVGVCPARRRGELRSWAGAM